MLTIKKQLVPQNVFETRVPECTGGKYTFALDEQNNTIGIKLHINTQESSILAQDFVIDLNAIFDNNASEDQSLWQVIGIASNFDVDKTPQVQIFSNPDDYFSMFLYSLSQRKYLINYTIRENIGLAESFVKIFIPFEGCNVNDVTLYVSTYDGGVFEFESLDAIDVKSDAYTGSLNSSILQPINVSNAPNSIATDSSFKLNISVDVAGIKQVYADARVGIINKSRVDLVNGQGSITVYTNGLEPGEKVDVRFGYKYVTSLEKVEVLVS